MMNTSQEKKSKYRELNVSAALIYYPDITRASEQKWESK
jgi:hypothetical protein